jgi:hypothetical protein
VAELPQLHWHSLCEGVPRAGLSREEARRIEAETHQRVHFLSYSIDSRTDLTGLLGERFVRFFDMIESQDQVDWQMIDEPKPENLLALYFLARAITCSNSRDAKMLLAERPRWLCVWQEAEIESHLRGSREWLYEDLSAGNAAAVAEQIKPYLAELACRIDSDSVTGNRNLVALPLSAGEM